MANPFPLEGGCTCGRVRYRMEAPPLFAHCCHCTWCQRETGSAFAVNALIETTRLVRLSGDPLPVLTPSASGRGQRICRCPDCRVALRSTYADAGPVILFLRVGTLDRSSLVPPDIHIYTSTRLSWVKVPPKVRAVRHFTSFGTLGRPTPSPDTVRRAPQTRRRPRRSSRRTSRASELPTSLVGRASGSFARSERRSRR